VEDNVLPVSAPRLAQRVQIAAAELPVNKAAADSSAQRIINAQLVNSAEREFVRLDVQPTRIVPWIKPASTANALILALLPELAVKVPNAAYQITCQFASARPVLVEILPSNVRRTNAKLTKIVGRIRAARTAAASFPVWNQTFAVRTQCAESSLIAPAVSAHLVSMATPKLNANKVYFNSFKFNKIKVIIMIFYRCKRMSDIPLWSKRLVYRYGGKLYLLMPTWLCWRCKEGLHLYSTIYRSLC